jgi:hypothetical protein
MLTEKDILRMEEAQQAVSLASDTLRGMIKADSALVRQIALDLLGEIVVVENKLSRFALCAD